MLYWKMEKTSLPFWQKVKGKIAQSKIFKHIFSAPLVKQYVCLSISVCIVASADTSFICLWRD